MDNTQNSEGDTISVSDQIDYILHHLDVTPLPGHVVATLCQSRRYIKYLENEFINLGLMENQLLKNEVVDRIENSLNAQNDANVRDNLSENNDN